jgi:hypothetical protein
VSREFDELFTAWTQEGQDEVQVEVNRRLWKRAAWRARAVNAFEAALLLAIAVVLIGNEILAPSLAGTALTAATLAFLLWVQWRRIKTRQDELVEADAERVGFLSARIASLRARMFRNGLALMLIVPGFGFGVVLARMRSPQMPTPQADVPVILAWLQSPAGKVVLIGLLLAIVIHLARMWLRDRRAVRTLALRLADYQRESLRDA